MVLTPQVDAEIAITNKQRTIKALNITTKKNKLQPQKILCFIVESFFLEIENSCSFLLVLVLTKANQ